MKLMRYGAKGAEKPALVDAQGQVRDLSALMPDITAATLSPAGLAALASVDVSTLPVVPQGEFQVPWTGMGKFICIGLNYSDHAAETGAKVIAAPMMGGPFVASSGEMNLTEAEPRAKDESWNERSAKRE